MIDFDLNNLTIRPEIGEVYYTYNPQQQAVRDQLIEMIEAERRAFLERIEPLIKQLSNIQGTPHYVIKTAPR